LFVCAGLPVGQSWTMARMIPDQSGFTLIEVLVAFAILGLSAGALLSIFSSDPQKIMRAADARLAVLTAQSVLAGVGSEQALIAGTHEGRTAQGVRWVLAIAPYEKPSSLTVPYLITVKTEVGTPEQPARAQITTVRLGVASP